MPALRPAACATIAAAGCVAAFAGAAEARIAGTGGDLIAFERGADIRITSDRGTGVLDLNVTNSPDALDSAPSWGARDGGCPLLGEDGRLIQPAGRTVVYESRAGGSPGDIVLTTLAGDPPAPGPTANLTRTPTIDEGAPAAGIPLNPADQLEVPAIVYTRGPAGRRDIWAMRQDGSGASQLTSGPADDRSPDWSSDGASVVYETADAGGRRQLAIIDVRYVAARPGFDADPPRFVTAGPEHHGDPSWWTNPLDERPAPAPGDPPRVPDPSRIVHVVTASGATYLDFLEQDPKLLTTGPLFAPASVPAPLLRQLTGAPGGDLAPGWRPEGDYVVFEGDRGQRGNRDLYKIKIDGTDLVRLTRDPAPDRTPDWEPYRRGFCDDPTPYPPRPGPQPRPDPPRGSVRLKIEFPQVFKPGKGKRRFVSVGFSVNKAGRATLLLVRRQAIVARTSNQQVSVGANAVRVRVPSRARGAHTLVLTVKAGSETKTVSDLKVKIKAPGRR